MDSIQFRAMRAAGIGCMLMLLMIGIAIFTLPSQTLIDYLTVAGRLVGQSTTVGILILAALPPLTGALCYYVWKWALK
ncbi:hypothetical protein [Necropsobacter massiliensis]|uniref:hypothetical protein n=1 Tax=Necropsobacter massiliensis TaxID=1400001 RepID=UPI0005963413|nr:hypothetical protein [Necropsobacter massiliensis]